MDWAGIVITVVSLCGGGVGCDKPLLTTKEALFKCAKLSGRYLEDIDGKATATIVGREDPWSTIESLLPDIDHVIFACLAVRPHMHQKEYPWLAHILSSGIPFSIIAAGTSLPVFHNEELFKNFSEGTQSILTACNERAHVFTSRGVLSQAFFDYLGLDAVRCDGDIAFYTPIPCPFSPRNANAIKHVVLSDPHYAALYLGPMQRLLSEIRALFPQAQVTVAMHGINPLIEQFCKDARVECRKIYEHPQTAWDVYDPSDLHIGFRVHAHVYALKNGIVSYLLEQDGRGADYALTLRKKVSVACPRTPSGRLSLWQRMYHYLRRRPISQMSPAQSSAVDQLLALVRADGADGYSRFLGMENEIQRFNTANIRNIRKIVEATQSRSPSAI